MTIEQLQVHPVLAQRCRELALAYPPVVFTSGRRDLLGQAHAMACHVATDRFWIQKVYLHAAILQTAIDQHPEAQSVTDLETLLYDTLLTLSSDELSQISDHLSGLAVDLHPLEVSGEPTPEGEEVLAWIRQCTDTKTLLTREGGQVIWHWAIHPQPVVV